MKKFINIVLFASILVGLSACGSEKCACNTFGKKQTPKTESSTFSQEKNNQPQN